MSHMTKMAPSEVVSGSVNEKSASTRINVGCFLRSIAELNSTAAQLCQCECSHRAGNQARMLLFDALRQLRTVCDGAVEKLKEDEQNGTGPVCFQVVQLAPQVLAQQLTLNRGTQELYNGFFLVRAPSHTSQFPVIAAVLLYNLGLINQRVGLDSGKSAHIIAALTFYKQSLFLLKDFRFPQEFTPQEATIKILMAALMNNMAHAYDYFYELHYAQAALEDLQVHVYNWMLADEYVPPSEIVFFQTTLLHFLDMKKHFAAASAAA